MIKSKQLLLSAALFVSASLTAGAQQAPKILVIDMDKVFQHHYKTVAETATLKADEDAAKTQLDGMSKEINDLVEEARALDESTKNPALSDDAKTKAKADLDKKIEEIHDKRADGQAYLQRVKDDESRKIQTFKSLVFDEISRTATDIAKRRGATFLLDKSGVSAQLIPVVVYSDPSADITDDVMAEIARDQPPASVTAPATPPSSSPTPSITMPSIPKG